MTKYIIIFVYILPDINIAYYEIEENINIYLKYQDKYKYYIFILNY